MSEEQKSGNQQEFKAQMVITLWPDDTISLTGPVQSKMISYGMLEYARDAIFEHHERLKRAKPTSNGFKSFVNGLKK